MEDELIWNDDSRALQDSEWSKLSSDFTNAGYREGITAGKESALQEGFDDGFATVGAPLGRELGLLRGMASALLSFLSRPANSEKQIALEEARDIVAQLGDVRFSDIVPPDLEAERHAREHLEAEREADDDADLEMNEELKEKRAVETLEDMMKRMGAGSISSVETQTTRPTIDDVRRLKERLVSLSEGIGIPLQWS
ncbi:hypothetical protein CERSUDRAFT_112239 [Gelatoporia subvermispora B]|uniref:Protein YAE1 n=1 Tax=Ceriporiopsis subvermispora (strain B) TaxID=914234 RepID=M2RMD3_CERS8|nr:hypothetical protein CERSUDRAFT_112239 [Gelatoporia subvermispora B]